MRVTVAMVVLLGLACRRSDHCVVGASVPCACADGSNGAQLCRDDGTYAACLCSSREVVAPPTMPPIVPIEPTPPPPRPAVVRSVSTPPRAEPLDGLSPMQRAQGCRTSTSNEPDRNNCIIDALRGHASSMQELGMLGATQMTAGHTADARRTMRTYIERFPDGPMVPTFRRYIDTH